VTSEPNQTDSPGGDRAGRSLARWLSAAVFVILLGAGAAAYLADRGRAEQSDGVSFVAGTLAAGSALAREVPSSGAPTSGPSTPEPTVEAAGAAVSATAVASPTVESASATPTAAPTEPPRTVELSAEAVGIGETLALRVTAPEAASGTVLALGASYPLLAEEDGAFFGVVGVPLNASLGPSSLALTLRDEFGTVIEERVVPFEVTTVERPIDYLTLTEEQGAELTEEAGALEIALRTEQFLTFDRLRRWSGLFRMPTEGFATTEFGQGRSINGGPVGGFHSGADIANEAGTLIQASAAARVAWAGEMPIRGNTVILDHGGGVKTGYHHMQAILVEVGQEVVAGTVVGEMGSTGLSTGPHLHWELTIYGVNVDPKTWTTVDFTPSFGSAADAAESPPES